MGIELPGWLTEPLSWITLEWPKADETKLFEAGQVWMNFGMAAIPIGQTATSAAENVWTINEGPQVEAFQNWWNDEDGPTKRLTEDGIGAMLIGAALILFAAITLAMKIAWIVALIILAAQVAMAIAASFATFGAASASIPGFIAVCRQVCVRLLRKVIDDVIKKSIRKLLYKAEKLFKKVTGMRRRALKALQRAKQRTWHFENGGNGWYSHNFPELRHGINPNFQSGKGFQINCQSCVVATDRSLAGFPDRAIPRPLDANGNPLPDSRFDWPSGVNNQLGGNNTIRNARGYDDIASELENAGPGARGIVHGIRRDEDGNYVAGHVFNAVNRNGQVHFIDGQTGNYAYLEDYYKYQWMRTG